MKDKSKKKEKKEINVQIGNRVRSIREKAELTQEEFAETLEITPQFVSDIERGVVGISMETLKRISERFLIACDEIVLAEIYRNEVDVLIEQLRRMPPEQLEFSKTLIDELGKTIAATKKKNRDDAQ